MEHFVAFPSSITGNRNQHGGREYNDLQNLLDMTSHENPLLKTVTH